MRPIEPIVIHCSDTPDALGIGAAQATALLQARAAKTRRKRAKPWIDPDTGTVMGVEWEYPAAPARHGRRGGEDVEGWVPW